MATGGATRKTSAPSHLAVYSLLYLTLSAATCQQQQDSMRDMIDNSILAPQQADVILKLPTESSELKQQQQQQQQDSSTNTEGSQPGSQMLETNSLTAASSPGGDQSVGSRLERRLDRLEFELRKSTHLMRTSLQQSAASAASNLSNSSQQLESRWLSVVARLEHMERFITLTTKKLYETEQRVKQLEKCDCRQSCRWTTTSAAPTTTTTTSPTSTTTKTAHDSHSPLNLTESVKLDGQVWRNKCDVCSCHQGKVRCRHTSCPKLSCPDPRNIVGQCCPVCYEPCFYRGQTVRHGNKLVINSNQDTCKECMCIDGRLRCQRVEVAETQPPANGSVAELTSATSGAPLPLNHWRQQRSTILRRDELANDSGDNDADDDDELLDEESVPGELLEDAAQQVRQRRSLLRQLPLVCPQVNCSTERQFRLQDDCCTYCQGFDFCAHNHHHQCHPEAHCLNAPIAVNLSSSSTGAELRPLLRLEAMFTCRCKEGFVGDGRLQCRDIDECAQRQLNRCDSRSTNCLNLAGSYRCTCKRGFRPIVSAALSSSDSHAASEEQVSSCEDVNECADGKLNRCHPQARCINLRGSYKCRCRRGYLGNGFECHQWFSSEPNVAAYLHRHGSGLAGASANGSSAASWSSSSSSSPPINEPLSSLGDPEDDQVDDDEDGDERRQVDSTAEDRDDELREESEDETASQLAVKSSESGSQKEEVAAAPKLSESSWEPLRLVEPTNSGQQPQQADNANQVELTSKQLQQQQQQQLVNNHRDLEQSPRSSENLNTRTMFFQPPPLRYWQTSDVTTERPAASGAPGTGALSSLSSVVNGDSAANARTTLPMVVDEAGNEHTATKGDNKRPTDTTNDSVNSQQQSSQTTVYQNDPEQIALSPGSQRSSPTSSNGKLTLPERGSIIMHNSYSSSSISSSNSSSSGSSSTNSYSSSGSISSPVYKKGTIIATAAIQPTRSQSSRMAHASHYQRSKATPGVTSSSTSSLRPPDQYLYTKPIMDSVTKFAGSTLRLEEYFGPFVQHFYLYMLISIMPLHFIFN